LLVNADNPGRFGLANNSSANREARVPIAGLSSAGYAYLTNNGNAAYDALIATLNHHLSRSFLLKVAFTHSRTVDNYQASPGTNYSGSALGNPYSLALNRGTSAQDIPNRLVMTGVWDIPGFKNGPFSPVLGHWALAGIATLQSGQAGVVTQNIGNGSFDSATGYGLILPGCKLVASGRVEDNIANYLNPGCATTQPLLAAGTSLSGLTPYQTPGSENYAVGPGGGYLVGAQTRGAFHAPFQQRTDLTLSKNFPLHSLLGEGGNLEFRAESFKISNNPIFSAPNASAGSPTFGAISSTIDSTGRQFQFALKATF
jgi:hypothetical protein